MKRQYVVTGEKRTDNVKINGVTTQSYARRRTRFMRNTGICLLFLLMALTAVLGFNLFGRSSNLTEGADGAVYASDDLAEKWRTAVENSSPESPRTFTLTSDWIATVYDSEAVADEQYGTSYTNQIIRTEFGRDEGVKTVAASTAFVTVYSTASNSKKTADYSGALNVPAGSSVILDLYGHTLDRNLTNTETGLGTYMQAHGYVIRVAGELVIKDSVGGGKITGGWSSSTSGDTFSSGIFVAGGGKLTLESGTISGNKNLGNSGAVSLYGGNTADTVSEFNMTGGEITENENSSTTQYTVGGVCLQSGSVFNMSGGKISRNKGSVGGILLCDIGTNIFNFSGGEITENESIVTGQTHRAGGVSSYNNSNNIFNMSGNAVISNNSGPVGGVGFYGGTINFTGGTIAQNKSTYSNGNAFTTVGGVYLDGCTFNMSGNALITQNEGDIGGVSLYNHTVFTLDGGKITENHSTATTVENYAAGGVFLFYYSKMIINGGEISKNVGLVGGVSFYHASYTSTVEMNDGKITQNVCNRSVNNRSTAGVFVDGIFTMTGGEITDNYTQSDDGSPLAYGHGGVGVYGTFTMEGGIISGNIGLGTTRGAGGITSDEGNATINLYGGTVTNNIGYISGGVFKYPGSTLNVQYKPVVKENYYVEVTDVSQITESTVKTPNDIDLYCGRVNPNYENRGYTTWRSNVINVPGGLEEGADLYVVKYTNNYVTSSEACITSNYYQNNSTYHPNNFFHPSLSDLFETNIVTPPTGYSEAGFLSKCDAQNWQDAIAASSSTNTLTVKLFYDWTATDYNGTKNVFKAMYYNDDTGFSGGSLHVPSGKSIILDLNGHTIDRNIAEALSAGYVIYNLGDLEITDSSVAGNGKITGGNNSLNGTGCGGGVYMASGGTFTLSGGIIDSNYANYGAGIYCASGKTYIKGGYITNNQAVTVTGKETTAGFGGAVYAVNPATLEISGGMIKGNSAVCGGGVEIYASNTSYAAQVFFTLKGGSVIDNYATLSGGGIDVYSINTYFAMGGNPVVKNNTLNGVADDIHLPSTTITGTLGIDNGMITIISRLNGSKENKYGVYRDIGYTFTVNFKDNNPSDSPADYFYAQKEGFNVFADGNGDGELVSDYGKDNWYSAVVMSRIYSAKKYTVKLTRDWTAVRNTTTNFNTSLYGDKTVDTDTSGSGPYYFGALNVPSGTDIILDLNGYTIDRALTTGVAGSQYGFVVYINGGSLTIRDTSEEGEGKVTGGWVHSAGNAYYGGGVSVASAASRFVLEGGSITRNKSTGYYSTTNARGVGGVGVMATGARFTMTGGSITDNIGSFAGGVGFYNLTANTFNLGGSPKIYDNFIGDYSTPFGQGTPSDVHNPSYTAGYTLAHMIDTQNYKITIVGAFTQDAHIGISRPDVNNFTLATTNGNVFTRAYSQYNTLTPDNYFFASNGRQSVIRTYAPQSGGMEATIWNVDAAKNWSDAHAAAVSATTGSPIIVTLEYDWIAENGILGTGSGFAANGSLAMSQSNIILDLNGYTIDRGLSATDGIANGYVLTMSGTCRLEIIDSSSAKTGKITGGNNTTAGEAGGINIVSSTAYLTLNGGTITGNRGEAGGVATYYESTYTTTNYFAMGDSALVTGNYDLNNKAKNINLRAKYKQQIVILSKLTKGGENGEQSGVYKESSSDFTVDFAVHHKEDSPVNYFVQDSNQHYVVTAPSGEAALYTMDNYSNWLFAVNESIATGSERTIMLVSDWDAPEGMFGKSTADNVAFYNGGSLYVPGNAKIILELNGYTLNRNLSVGADYGFVILNDGKLTIRDSYTGGDRYGRIIGGNNITTGPYYVGGGINNRATLYIESGVIENNSSSGDSTYSSGGVYNAGAASVKMYMTGGVIRNNYGAFTGGVDVHGTANVYLGGGAQIYGNKLITSSPSDIRPISDSSSYKIVVYSAFNGDANVGVAYIGNNYSNVENNKFTTGYGTLNEGVEPSSVFHYSNPLTYRIIESGQEAAVECIDNEQNWRQAIAASSATVTYTVTLSRDWVAYEDGTYVTAFGTDTGAYYFGALYLPANKSIILDLNGYTIDRNLVTSRTYGLVLYVKGNLEITDSSSAHKGKITGGKSTDTAGGIKYESGSLTLTGGTITGNAGTVGGIDVCFSNSAVAPLSMGGSALVTGNTDNQKKNSDIVATSPVQMIDIISPLTAVGKTGFSRPGVGDFTTDFVRVMRGADPAEYFTSTEPMYVYTYETGEGAIYTNDNATNWEYAVKASIAGGKKQITFMLVSDWTAVDGIFGKDETAYVAGNGALYVPNTADIVVDLNGYTLDRHLEGAVSEGYIFRIYGNLTIRDTSELGNGVITGGFNNYNSSVYSAQSSVFYVYSGAKLNIEGGTITGNHATGDQSSVMTVCYNASPVTVTGGTITGNYGGSTTSDNGAGAVFVMTSLMFKLGGSAKIIDNHHNGGYDCDVRFSGTGVYVEIISSFTSQAKIGVAPSVQVNNWANSDGGVQFTSNYSAHHNSADYPSRYFEGRWYQSHSVSRIVTTNGIEGSFWCTENYTNWINAVAASSTTKTITFELTDDWIAESHATYTTSFHPSNTSYYMNGAIYLPVNRSIILDLKGYTIDRSLFNPATNGYAIYVAGNLEIIDSSNKKTGKITGAYNNSGGGGIVVASGGTLSLQGGTVTGNYGQSEGGGVYIMDGGHIEIGGYAQICGNYNLSGYDKNLYINKASENIKIVDEMSGKELIGVSRPGNGYVTEGFQTVMPGYSPLDYFVSEHANYYGIESGDGELFFLSPDNGTNWQYAVNQSLNTGGKVQTVRLTGDWFAEEGGSYGTQFGTGTGYYYGALQVPSGASIELDLAGFTISRNLNAPTRFGTVITVCGNLTVLDSSEESTGTITGGMLSQVDSYFQSAGVHVHSKANFQLLGGSITGNRENTTATNIAGGVYVVNSGTFVLKDAAVTGNVSGNAGVYIENGAIMSVGGAAVVDDNKTGAEVEKDIVFNNYTSVLNVTSAFTGGAHLGIYRTVNIYDTRSYGGSVVTSDYSRYNTKTPDTYFFASDPTHGIIEYAGVGVKEAALYCYDNQTNWTNATNSSYSTQQEVTFKLYGDWTADVDNNTTTFGTTGVSYYYGALRVYSNVQIVLDLNNFVLDRALTRQATDNNGFVIYVEGSLTVTDTSLAGAGQIKGGWNTNNDINSASYASGIHVCSGGKFAMDGGAIEGNVGVGLYLAGNNVFSLGGNSRITNNAFYGGAAANIYLNNATQTINIISEFGKNSAFGVIRTKGSTNFASGTLTTNYSKYNNSVEPTAYFVSDDDLYNVISEGLFEDESMEAAIIGKDNFTNWAYAVKTSLANGGRAQVCTLYEDWTAETHATYTTSFGDVSGVEGFYRGALYVPQQCYIILDLNGHTVDRALLSAIDNGEVIYVRGTLVIRDSSEKQTGKITGGYSTGGSSYYSNGCAGGVSVYVGTLSIEGGTIKGNRMSHTTAYAGGVYLSGGSTFSMTGGKITENYGRYNGGVYVDDNAVVRLGGTPYISGNLLMNEFGAALDQNSNLYFRSASNLVSVTNLCKEGSKVGISVNSNQIGADGRFITSGWVDLNNNANVTTVFYSDNPSLYVLEDYKDADGHEAVLYCRDNQVNWQNTVIASINEKTTKTFVLYEDWTAAQSGSVTIFGSGTGYYYGGALHVPGNASIILDLNGHTIDRGLYNRSEYYSYGYVIVVDGSLTIIDSTAYVDRSGNIVQGSIKGGYSYDGGAIHSNYGIVDVEAGLITENKVIRYGAGIFYAYNAVTIGGTVQFKDNYHVSGTTLTREDVCFYYNSKILNIGSQLITGADETKNDIYIRKGNIGTFTSGWGTYNADINPETRFKSYLDTFRVYSTGTGAQREAALLSNNNNDNWVFAVTASKNGGGTAERFTLIDDWTASSYSGGSYNTRFGTDSTAYRNGALLVPAGAYVVLDLNGFTLDRNHGLNFDAKYADINATIIVEGTLQIIDSSVGQKGTITGGSYGVFVNGGTVTIGGLIKTATTILTGSEAEVYGSGTGGGAISGNSLYGAYVKSGAFTATGGKVTGNTNADVFVGTNATLNVAENAYLYTENRQAGSGVRLENPLAVINIVATLSDDARIGFMRQSVGQITSGWGENNGNDSNPLEQVFVCEEPDKYKPATDMFGGYTEITVSSYDSAVNWQFAVDKSLLTGEAQEFVLYSCWNAEEDETYTTSFGLGTAYRYGALYVPEGAKIILNLNGHKLNRNLSDAVANGMVIYVDGEIEIKDEQLPDPDDIEVTCCEVVNGKRAGGTVTGGANSTAASAAAIYVGANGSAVLNGGTLCGNKETSQSSGSGAVYAAGKFEMNGGAISGNGGYSAGAVYVSGSGSFEMNGGTLGNNEAVSGGGAVYVTGKFSFNGGEITDNAGLIGGVYVASGGQFTMDGGASATGNRGSSAGAVFVNSGTTTFFKMYGGEISGNTAVSAGAIYAAGTVEIEGGKISSNTATGTTINDGGGAIYVSGTGNVIITGGEITANSGENGIRVHASGTIGVGGSARIYDNIATNKTNVGGQEAEANDFCDIYLTVTSRKINVVSEFSEGARVGVYRLSAGLFTSGYGMYNGEHPNKYFVSNRSIYAVSLSAADDVTDTEAYIGISVDSVPSGLETPNIYNGDWQTIIENIDLEKVSVGTLDEGVRVTQDENGRVTVEAVNAGTYAVSFTLNETYCWPDGTTTEKIVLASISAKEVELIWSHEVHEDENGNPIVDGQGNPVCVYDGVTSHGAVAEVSAGSLVTNVLTGEPDICGVVISGRQVVASSGDGHTATAVGVDNPNYKLGENVEYKFVVEKTERTSFAVTSTETYYKTPTAMEVTGNTENGKLHFSIDAASMAYASIDEETGELTVTKYDRTQDTIVTVTVVADETDNYKSSTATAQILCVPGELKTEIIPAEMLYGDTVTLALANYDGGEMGAVTWSVSNGDDGGQATLRGSDTVYASHIGTVKVTAKVAASTFYRETVITGTITINRRVISIDWGDSLTVEYNGEEQTLAAPLYDGVLESDKASFVLNVYKAGYAGWETAKVAAVWTESGVYDVGLVISNENYSLASEEEYYPVFEIKKAKPDLKFTTTTVYYDTPFKPEVEGNDGGGTLTVQLTGYSMPISQFKYDASAQTYTVWALGTMTFTAKVSETANYEAATIVATFNVVQAEMPMEISPSTLYYGDERKQLTASYSEPSGLKTDVTDKVTFVLDEESAEMATLVEEDGKYYVTPKHAGVIKIIASSEAVGNYVPTVMTVEIEIKPCELQVEWTFDEEGYVYNGGVQTPVAKLTGIPLGDDACSVTGVQAYKSEDGVLTETEAISAGTYIVKALFDNPDYIVSSESSAELVIRPLPVNLTWSDTRFVYNGEVQAPTANVGNLIDGDVCNVTVLGTKDAGENLSAVATGLDNGNYTLTGGQNLTATFYIDPLEITVVWGETELVYTGVSQYPAATAEGLLEGDSCSVIVSGAQINVNNPDEPYLATATGLTNGNYTLGDKQPAVEFNIVAAELEISLKQTTAVYGTAFTLEIAGNAGNGRVTFTLGEGSENATLGTGNWFTPVNVGTVEVIAKVAATGNYTEAEITQIITINPRPVEIIWSELSFEYDGQEHNATASVYNAVNGDVVNVTLSGAKINAGTYTAEVLTVDNEKYTVTGGEKLTEEFVINKRVLTVVWSNTEFVYDGTEQAPTAEIGNLVDNDTCNVVVRGAIDAGNRLLAEIISVSNTNYTVEGSDDATVRFNIAPLLAKLEWSNTTLKYNGTEQKPDAKVTNLCGDDLCEVTVSGAQIEVGEYTATATVLSNSNYTLIFDEDEEDPDKRTEVTKEFVIEKADIEIGLASTEVVYGSQLTLAVTDNPENCEVTYVVTDGTGSATVEGQTLTGTKAGTVTVTVTVADSDNYNGGTKDIEVTVRQLPVEIRWSQDVDFIYNGKVQTPVATVINAIEGTACNVTAVDGQSAAGANCIATVTALDNDNYTLVGGANISTNYVIQALPVTAVVWDTDREYLFNGKSQGPGAVAEGILEDDECEVTVSGWKINVGDYTAEITGLSNSNYSLVGIVNLTADFKILVSEPDIKITTAEVVLGSLEKIEIEGNIGGGDVTFELLEGAEYAELSGDTLYGKKLGTVKIKVTVSATANTEAATAEGEIKIIKGKAPLKLEKTTVTYGSKLTLTMDDDNGNLSDGDGNLLFGEVTFTVEPRFANLAVIEDGNVLKPLSAGTLMLRMSVEDSESFDATEVIVEITVLQRIVNLAWSDGGYVYNGSEQAPEVTVTNLVEGDECEVIVTYGKDAGDYTAQAISLTGADSKNYTLERAVNTEKDFTIVPCVLTLTWGDTELPYNGEEQIPEATLSALCGEDDCDVILVVDGEHKNVGTYTVRTDGLSNSNYVLDAAYELVYNIVRADLNPSLKPVKITYGATEELVLDGNLDNAAYTLTVLKNDSVGLGTLQLKDGAYRFTATRTGTVKIKVEIEASDNCNAYGGVLEIEVTKAEREVDLITVEGVYGEELVLEVSGNDGETGNIRFIAADEDMASIDGNVLTPKHAGVVTITIIVDETENYVDQIPTVVQVKINPRVAEINWKATEFIYNGELQTPEAEVANLLNGDECGLTVIGGKVNAGTYNDARVYSLDNPDYTLVGSITSGTIFTIGKKDIDDLDLVTTRVNIGVPTQLILSGNDGNAPATFTVENTSGKATITADGILTSEQKGSVTVTVEVAESENYLGNKITRLVIIDRSNLDITLKNDTVQYGDTLLLEVDGNVENSAVLYTVIDDTGSAAILGGDTLKPLKAGKVLLRVNIAETANYAATEVTFEVTITPIKVELGWGNTEFTYDGINRFAPTARIISGLIDGDVCTVEVLGGQVDAGEWDTAYAASLSNPNYTLEGVNVKAPGFVINRADPVIKFETTAVTINVPTKLVVSGNMEFGSIEFTFGAVGEGLSPVGEASISGGVITGTKLGYVHVIATVMPTQNYNGASAECDVLVEKPAAPVDLENAEVTYGETLELVVTNDDREDGYSYELSLELIPGDHGDASLDGNNILTALAAGEVHIIIRTTETESYKATEKIVTVTIKPIVVQVEWTVGEYVYDGTEKKPEATVVNTINGDVCDSLTIVGSVDAGVNLTATLSDTGNPNYTAEGSPTATTLFTVKPMVAELEWAFEELTYNGQEQVPVARISNLIDGDEAVVTVSGETNAGTNLTATAVSIDNGNYTLEGTTNAETTYTINPYAVYITWGDLRLTYNGKTQVPAATAIGTLNGDVANAVVNGSGKNASATPYKATATRLDNPNYTLKSPETTYSTFGAVSLADDSAEPVAGNLSTEYYIDPVRLTFQTENYVTEYNGEKQNPKIEIILENKTDDLTLTFKGGDQINVGEYEIELQLSGASMNNYYLAEEDVYHTFIITPKKVNVVITTLDKIAEYTGSAVALTDWYKLTCDEFVGVEAGKSVEEVFAMNTLKITPQFELNGEILQAAGVRGEYKIIPVMPVTGELGGSANYEAVLVANETEFGTLKIEGGESLELAETSAYKYIFLEEKLEYGDIYSYRRTYDEKGWVHGKDDVEFDRVVLGNILPYTSVGDFLNNLKIEQLDSIRIYNNMNELIYDCGKAAEGIDEVDLYDSDYYAVGTGWRVLFGKDEDMADVVYLSVLGDLSGDGYVLSDDIFLISRYISNLTDFSDAELMLAGLMANDGFISAQDVTILSKIIKGIYTTEDFM